MDPGGPARALSPKCFLQGSYRQQTAIYTINDVDLVVLCALWQPGSGNGGSWDRDEIFTTIAAPLRRDYRYRDKIRYGSDSMCIKVDLDIKVEILPVVYAAGNYDPAVEPFRLWRPETGQWEDGYARDHQRLLSRKNVGAQGNFIPAVKVFKHLRSLFGTDAVSFHIECLLYSLPDHLYAGGPASYIPALLEHISATSADGWYGKVVNTPCRDRDIFVSSEWTRDSWRTFHERVVLWHKAAAFARNAPDLDVAIDMWQSLLDKTFFPERPS